MFDAINSRLTSLVSAKTPTKENSEDNDKANAKTKAQKNKMLSIFKMTPNKEQKEIF